MIAGVWGIAFVGLIVWSHHMFTTGLEVDTIAYFSIMTMVIAIPTGAKIYNYMQTMQFNVSYVV
jgi:heme/copper-type cytochrome/quinol oxidase subunit 1